MNLWKKVKEKRINFHISVIDPMIGKTVIRFTTHGCMAQIHEFDYIGKIVDTVFRKDKKFYKVDVLKSKSGEKRDGNITNQFVEVPSWYLQNLGGDFFIAYD